MTNIEAERNKRIAYLVKVINRADVELKDHEKHRLAEEIVMSAIGHFKVPASQEEKWNNYFTSQGLNLPKIAKDLVTQGVQAP